MSERTEITDQEFLDEMTARLRRSGHHLIFVDRGLWLFLKAAAAVITILVTLFAFMFGYEIKEAREELRGTLAKMTAASDKVELLEDELDLLKYRADQEIASATQAFSVLLTAFVEAVYSTAGEEEIAEVERYLKNMIDLAAIQQRPKLQIQLISKLADLEYFRRDWQKFSNLYSEALEIARTNGLKEIQAQLYLRRAERELWSVAESVTKTQARRMLNMALRLYKDFENLDREDLGWTMKQADIYSLIAQAYRIDKDHVQALENIKKAYELYLRVDAPASKQIGALVLAAKIHMALDRKGKAIDNYEDIFAIAETAGDQDYTFRSALELARLYYETKDGKARRYLCKAKEYLDKLPYSEIQRLQEMKFDRAVERYGSGTESGEGCRLPGGGDETVER